jgi:hypothetical protein
VAEVHQSRARIRPLSCPGGPARVGRISGAASAVATGVFFSVGNELQEAVERRRNAAAACPIQICMRTRACVGL